MTRRLVIVGALGAVLGLLTAAPAFAHAEISPPVALAKTLQLFTLAVPTEKENATTTEIALTLPSGFSIDSFVPSPGWKREVQQTGSGEDAVVQKVTWTGGKVPTDDDSVFQFLATASDAKTYTFGVRQTYSDGSIVDWSGAGVVGQSGAAGRGQELARRRWFIDARDRRARARSRRARDRARRGCWPGGAVSREPPRAALGDGRSQRAGTRAAGRCVRPRGPAAHGAVGERDGEHLAARGRG